MRSKLFIAWLRSFFVSGGRRGRSRCDGKKAGEAMHTDAIGGKSISVFPGEGPGAPVIYLHAAADEGRQVFAAARAAGCPPFTLVAVCTPDWNRDMAPWDSPAAFKGGQPFTGGADGHLRLLTETILPQAEKALPGPPAWRGIAGYSLAGLFALYAVYRTDVFSRVGCISGSLWFPGFRAYVFSHTPRRRPDCVYFSLGDKEAKTRNPVLQTVQEDTRAIHAFFRAQGIDTAFRLHPGGHFAQSAERTAAGIRWLLGRPAPQSRDGAPGSGPDRQLGR